MTKEALTVFPLEVTSHVTLSSLNGRASIEMNGVSWVADSYSSYVEFRLAHAFPVVTVDGLALHPQVVANSYKTLKGKVFNFGHIMKAYNPEENHRDRILGTIMDVEFPPKPFGSDWKVQSSRAAAPGIRAVAVMHKQAEGVDRIIGQFKSGRKKWTVSRENDYYLEDSGFLVKCPMTNDECRNWGKKTPEDILALGYVYVPCVEAPEDLLECYEPKSGRIRRQWQGCPVVLLVSGLNGSVQFKGTGLTPLGKEAEARILELVASGCSGVSAEEFLNDDPVGDGVESVPTDEMIAPLKNILDFSQSVL